MPSPLRCAIYARISDDREGKALGVRRQEKDCSAKVAWMGGVVSDVFIDNDLTAADPDVYRPEFERMLEGVLAGDYDAVVVYNQGRLVRQPEQMERVIRTVVGSGVQLVAVTGNTGVDSPEARLFARIKVDVDAFEVEQIRVRVMRKQQERLEHRLTTGGLIGYGYTDGKVDEAEAKLIKEAVERVLANEAMYGIVADWNSRGVPTKGGKKPWSATVLRRILLSPRIAGLLCHNGKMLGAGAWEAIIEPETRDKLIRLFSAPGRFHQGSTVQHLLTGVLTCGPCGSSMNHKLSDRGVGKYFCRHCFGCTITSDDLETLVIESALDTLDGPALAARMEQHAESGAATLIAEIEAAEADKLAFARDLGKGEISVDEWKAFKEPVVARLRALNARLRAEHEVSVLDTWLGRGEALRAAWETLSVDQRRAIIGSLFPSIVIGPAVRGRNRFDPSRVTLSRAA
jgi:site-specific DNA recombinase